MKTDVNDSILHQTVDGRIERRQRRSAVRSHIEKLDTAYQKNEAQSKAQIAELMNELRAKDREIYELQNATIIVDTDRVWDLEQQVEDLQSQLKRAETQRHQQQQRQEQAMCPESVSSSRRTSIVDWTLAARDPYDEASSDMDLDDFRYDATNEDMFGNATLAQLECGTPSRARASFPTPPATSPCEYAAPITPSLSSARRRNAMPATPSTASTGVQAMLPDLEKEAEIDSLQRETRKLTETLDNYKSLMERLTTRLPQDKDEQDDVLSAEETVEKRVESILTWSIRPYRSIANPHNIHHIPRVSRQ